MIRRRDVLAGIPAAAITVAAWPSGSAAAVDRDDLNGAAERTLALLRKTEPVSADFAKLAKGILVFPEIVKGGLLIGAASGKGVLRIGGRPEGYYRSTAVSYGLQAGIAKFGYVMFLMDSDALGYVRDTKGWEVGVGPNITVADEGFARKFSTTSMQHGIYVFFVGQEGFFAGAGIEGTKISRIGN